MFYELFDFIGETGPITLFLLIIILLYKRKEINLIFYFIIFQIINNILNLLLKLFFKQPRPSNPHKDLSFYKSIFSANKYGMPSGHAQMITSELLFIIYYFKNTYLTLFALFQTFITLAQRYYSNYHTLIQIVVGTLIGASLTLLFLRNLWSPRQSSVLTSSTN